MYTEKEFDIKIISSKIFWMLMLVLVCLVSYYSTGSFVNTIITCYCSVVLFALVLYICDLVVFKKIKLKYKDDILDITFTGKNKSKNYNIDLSKVTSYKEIKIPSQNMVFKNNEKQVMKIPFSKIMPKEFRDDLVLILANYNFDKDLSF